MAVIHIGYRWLERVAGHWWLIWPLYFVIAALFLGLMVVEMVVVGELWGHFGIADSIEERSWYLIGGLVAILISYAATVFKITGKLE